jgi:hypothetical protein
VGKNQRPRYDVCLGEVEAATLSQILRDPEQFARGFKHGYLIRKVERHRAREEA